MDANNALMMRSKNVEQLQRYQKLLEFMYNYNFDTLQNNGQRISSPRNKNLLPKPEPGCEVFIGKIPRDVFEDELIPLFERIGKVYQFRLMLDFSGLNRGFAFVTYMNLCHANMAIECLNKYEIRRNRFIGVYRSIDNCRLFVGGIPVNKTKAEVLEKLSSYVENIVGIIMYPSHTPEHVNRGYVFVEFSCHRMAAMARRQLGSGVVLWDSTVAVDWADPIPQVDPTIMSQVTKLYVRNLPVSLTEEGLRDVLEAILDGISILKVYKVKDYAFVHFHTRSDAEIAMEHLKGTTSFNTEIEVTWARPPIYSKHNRLNSPAENFCISVPPRMRKVVQQMKLQNQTPIRKNWEAGSSSSSCMSPSTSYSSNYRCDDSFIMGPVGLNLFANANNNGFYPGVRSPFV